MKCFRCVLDQLRNLGKSQCAICDAIDSNTLYNRKEKAVSILSAPYARQAYPKPNEKEICISDHARIAHERRQARK